jgi:hypothetical protein
MESEGGEAVADGSAVVPLHHEAREDKPARVLGAGFHIDMQAVADLNHRQLRCFLEEFYDFDAAMIRKSPHDPLKLIVCFPHDMGIVPFPARLPSAAPSLIVFSMFSCS